MSKIRKVLKDAFANYPLITNSVIYGTLYVGAEFSQQTLTRKMLTNNSQPIDIEALSRFGIYGTTIQGPILTTWYSFISLPLNLDAWFVLMLQKGQSVPYDPHMITRFGILGVAVYPPVYYYWYKWLDKTFVGTSVKVVTKKLILDQFLLTPPLLVIFYVAMSVMEKKQDLLQECKQKIAPTFTTSCLFWLPAQAVNFLLVPPAFRVTYVGTCAFAWVNILCWFKRQEY